MELRQFSDSYDALSLAYSTGDPAEAEKVMQELVGLADGLEKKYPSAFEYSKIRWVAQLRLYRVLSFQGREADAEAAMSAALREFRRCDDKHAKAEESKLRTESLELLAAMENRAAPQWMK